MLGSQNKGFLKSASNICSFSFGVCFLVWLLALETVNELTTDIGRLR